MRDGLGCCRRGRVGGGGILSSSMVVIEGGEMFLELEGSVEVGEGD